MRRWYEVVARLQDGSIRKKVVGANTRRAAVRWSGLKRSGRVLGVRFVSCRDCQGHGHLSPKPCRKCCGKGWVAR